MNDQDDPRVEGPSEQLPAGERCSVAQGSASGPKFKVGDRVSVPVRFGETGTVKELKDGRYGVEFHNLPMMTLWYDENELRPQTGKGFNWFRMPNEKLSESPAENLTQKP